MDIPNSQNCNCLQGVLMRRRTRLTSSRLSSSDRKHRRYPNSKVIKRSIKLAGNKTSVSLEDGFWSGLQEIAVREGIGTSALIERIDNDRSFHNLSSAIRLFVLAHFRARAKEQVLAGASPKVAQYVDQQHNYRSDEQP
jgi:predicted DNA-binding ribbon-helix-helix protein